MNQPAPLSAPLDGFGRVRVLVLGDIMLDRYVYGAVERISPEAPIPVLRVERERVMPGGAGNVARNVAALGAGVTLIGLVGDDDAGRALARLLADAPAVEQALVTDAGRQTTQKTRFVAGTQQLLRTDGETTAWASEAAARRLLDAVDRHLGAADVVVLSDYAKGVLSDAVLSGAIARAKAAGKPVIADPKNVDFRRYRGVDLLTPNRHEIAAAVRQTVPGATRDPGFAGGYAEASDDAWAAEAAHATMRDCGIAAVLVTRGERGMTLVQDAATARHLRAEAREVFDVSGAGDTTVATLAVTLAAGADLATAAELANLAAGIVVGRVGTAQVSRADLATALQARAAGASSEAKIAEPATAQERVAAWRRGGHARIGFTNGCFDLIHPGHVALLTQARGACDRLIVGLNSDASVRRLKGPDRPIQPESARAIVLASLGSVDLVVPFGEDTPIELIRALRPDVLVKGADYRADQVVGGEFVQSYGGRVLLVPIVPGNSTTGTVARIGRVAE